MSQPKTFGELKDSGWQSVSVKHEIRRNAIRRIRAGEDLFPGIWGYEDTVIPQLETALLAGHDVIFLGERGQAKTRMIRLVLDLLDEWLPIVAGSEVNDDPYNPVSKHAKDLIASKGDKTPLAWVHRSERYGEKLATPDTSIADLIGEVDPIKVAEGRYLSDELTIHYGLVPRTNRGVFAMNELPDLAERIQVGLLNVLEERDVQIRGHKIRLPLDILLFASANPEDYTNRGRIITPLKDRFGAQIRTHYPTDVDIELDITEQEATIPEADVPVVMPDFMSEGAGLSHPLGPAEPPHQPAFGCVGAVVGVQLRDAGRRRHTEGPAHRRGRGCTSSDRFGRADPLHHGQDRNRDHRRRSRRRDHGQSPQGGRPSGLQRCGGPRRPARCDRSLRRGPGGQRRRRHLFC